MQNPTKDGYIWTVLANPGIGDCFKADLFICIAWIVRIADLEWEWEANHYLSTWPLPPIDNNDRQADVEATMDLILGSREAACFFAFET